MAEQGFEHGVGRIAGYFRGMRGMGGGMFMVARKVGDAMIWNPNYVRLCMFSPCHCLNSARNVQRNKKLTD